MIRMGIILIITAIILWIVFFVNLMITQSEPNENIITASLAIGFFGGILLLLGVGIDRYQEYKEDRNNDDYRKY